MEQILDTPVKLYYNCGSTFPGNAKMIGYALLGVGLISTILVNFILGPILFTFGVFICFTSYGVEFLPESKEIVEFTKYAGFITVKKKFSYEKWGFLSVVPKITSARIYGRSSNSTTITENHFTVSLIGKNYRGKKDLLQFDSKNKAEEIAKALCDRLNLEFFAYDPLVVRNAYRK